jgi:hypothetical protein
VQSWILGREPNEIRFYDNFFGLCLVLLDGYNFLHYSLDIEPLNVLLELTSLELSKAKNVFNIEQQQV